MGVLITGGNGFVGKKLVDYLAKDFSISITQRTDEIIPQGVVKTVVTGDLAEFSEWDSALTGCSQIVHLASFAHKHAQTIQELEQTNISALKDLLVACKNSNIKKFIYFSTAYVHGKHANLAVKEDSSLIIGEPQLQTRIIAENLVKTFCSDSGIDYIIIRPTLVLSHDAPGNIRTLAKLVSKVHAFPFKAIRNQRSYLSVDKLLSFIKLCLMTDKANCEIYLLADEKALSLQQVLNYLAGNEKVNIRHFYFPEVLLRLALRVLGQKERENVLLDNFVVDSSKADKLLTEINMGRH
ncbi:NAD-dependent epimerase/dehydratase family protein [Pseudoalteromonas arctica]|uniref:NAD-dependent epimerase/dehydratase family protein n=1 Tax=Pseudoalteromonas arctica TaxID=394751 RepID=UPI001C9CE807|nr:NAD-dependent epimerase/dehydratase family protein [Pseudoalteromonas arctica]MBZ2191372.1 NAD-dependent epimerase/dehydratase family protein [Pseudoalteromonas arctica]